MTLDVVPAHAGTHTPRPCLGQDGRRLPKQQRVVVMGPGIRRDDERIGSTPPRNCPPAPSAGFDPPKDLPGYARPTQISKTTPCKVARRYLNTCNTSDVSGKSPATIHHRAIVRPPRSFPAAGCPARSQAGVSHSQSKFGSPGDRLVGISSSWSWTPA